MQQSLVKLSIALCLLNSATSFASAQHIRALFDPPVHGAIQVGSTQNQDPMEALAGKWDHQCGEKGCLMFTDVLIGDPDHPADLKHPEYITLGLAINRADRKPAFFSFMVPPDADPKSGVIIGFANDVKDGDRWKVKVEQGKFSQLDFNECNKDSCVARVHPQILSSGGTADIDLLEKFLNSNHILLMYYKHGVPYRTMKPLFPFQRDYKALLETELKPAKP
jgi:hypothetical protein